VPDVKKRTDKQVYIILSVDTEHDIVARYQTRSAGWSKGIPLFFQAFDEAGVRGKVCWLIEYNVKEGIPAANPGSEFFVQEFPEFIRGIKDRGDELGLHPTMADWTGTKQGVTAADYVDSSLWDAGRRYDAGFVGRLIAAGVQEMVRATGVHPVGCRTGHMNYAAHLAEALEQNGVFIDSSVSRRTAPRLAAPGAYYADPGDVRKKSPGKTGVVEIPTTGYICFDGIQRLLLHKARVWYWLNRRGPVFLSFFVHNWQAVTPDGGVDREYLKRLSSFLGRLRSYGAIFLGWTEARQLFDDLYGEDRAK
jgi:hypothetical protein